MYGRIFLSAFLLYSILLSVSGQQPPRPSASPAQQTKPRDEDQDVEAPDFTVGDQTLVKENKRKSNPGRFFIRFYMPGLDPENAFREMAKIEFDDTLSQTTAFTDKFFRAVTTLAVAEVCLQQAPAPKEPGKPAKP